MSETWTRVLGAALCVRVVLDWSPVAVVPGLRSAASGAVLLALVVVLARHAGRIRGHALLPWIGLFTVLVLGNALRATSDPLRWIALYLGPWLVLYGASLAPVSAWWRWSRLLLWTFVPAAAWGVWGIATDAPSDFVLNGYPRLLGAYENPHGHAVMLVLWASVGVLWAERRAESAVLGAAVAVTAVLLLGFTWVRTAMLMLAIQLGVFFLLRRQRVPILLGGLGVFAAFAVSSGLRERFSDVLALMTGHPPAGGWGAIGSHRVDIWREVLTPFLDGGPSNVVMGQGLGAHHSFHKGLDPHSEFITLWVQLGVLGPLLWFGSLARGGLVLLATPKRNALQCFALSWVVALTLTAPLSNEILNRVTFGWWIWAAMGFALSSPTEKP